MDVVLISIAPQAHTAYLLIRMQRHDASPRFHSDLIQLMRFVAAAIVVVTHTTFYYHERVNAAVPIWHGGEIGVPIFFVISGIVIVISSVDIRSGTTGAAQFLYRRLLRIVPLYWIATAVKVVATLAVPAAVLHNHFDAIYAVKSFLFFPALNPAGEVRPIHGVGWTLFHEMLFYLVFAAAIATHRTRVTWACIVIAGLVVLGIVLPSVRSTSAVAVVLTNPINLCFVIGMIVGLTLWKSGPRSAAARWTAGALLLVACVESLVAGSAELLPDPVVMAGAAVMLLLATQRLPAGAGPLLRLGDSSYALYLFHPLLAPPLLLLAHRAAPAVAPELKMAFAVLAVVSISHGIHLVVERPATRWLKRKLDAHIRAGTAVTGAHGTP